MKSFTSLLAVVALVIGAHAQSDCTIISSDAPTQCSYASVSWSSGCVHPVQVRSLTGHLPTSLSMIIDPGFPERNIVDSLKVHGGSSLDWRVNIPGGSLLRFAVRDARFSGSSTAFVTVANSSTPTFFS
ncbi:hypothetical protein C8Q76DRAFT_694880 [Earliella scabrosa]|nr:hypothetical protein C8Q76DRAFT_694880 [Earliella scabrosa]